MTTGVLRFSGVLGDPPLLTCCSCFGEDIFLGEIFLDPDHPQLVLDTFKDFTGLRDSFSFTTFFITSSGLELFSETVGLELFFKAVGLELSFKLVGLELFFKVVGLEN